MIGLSNDEMVIHRIRQFIESHPDFPEPNVVFRDIAPLLASTSVFEWKEVLRLMIHPWNGQEITKIGAFDARGFLFAGAIKAIYGIPFFMIRKKGKIPGETLEETYKLEYGTATIQISKKAVQLGDKVLLLDDVLATGGTCDAGRQIIQRMGGECIGLSVLIELLSLKGRERLEGLTVSALLHY